MSYKEAIQMLLADPEKMNSFFEGMMKSHYDNEEYWQYICKESPLTLDFIKKYVNDINWKFLLKYQKLDSDVLSWLKDNHDFNKEEFIQMIIYQTLSEELIMFYIDRDYPNVPWKEFAYYQALTNAIIDKYKEEWDWETITLEQKMSQEFIDRYRDRILWKLLPLNFHTQYLMDDSFVEKYKEEMFWENIGLMTRVTVGCLVRNYERITENGWYSIFIYSDIPIDKIQQLLDVLPDKYNNNLIWESISSHQDLSIEFIEKYADKLNWNYISAHQDLSWDLIEKHHEKISLYYLSRNSCLDLELIEKIEQNTTLFKDSLDKELLSL